MHNLVGVTLDQYQVLVKIRETPTRILFRAYNTQAQNYIALEVLKTAGPDPAELLQLINAQVRRNLELIHPNIATITDTGLYQGLIYIVYNFSPTRTLRRFFDRKYSWQETARDLVSITHAMAYAHEKGVVHGALHPSSIVLDEKRNPILFDFGFEQIISSHILAFAPGAWINRWGFEYRAPEQLNGALPDARCDVYAMGVMLHEWLNAQIPLLESTILGTLQVRSSLPVTFNGKPALPSSIQNLIRKCIAIDPADRYQSMKEVYVVLARGALDMSITQGMVRRPLEIPVRRFDPRPAVRKLAVPGVIFSISFLAILLMSVAGLSSAPTTTATASPTSTLTSTSIPPTPTSTFLPEPLATATPPIVFPAFQATPISSAIKQAITTTNLNQMITLSILGIGDVNRVTVSPNGRYAAVGSSIGIFIFDARTLRLEKHIDTRSWITALDFSSDSSVLATGDRDGLIELWNTTTWEEAAAPYSGHTKAILDLDFSPDGSKLASVSLDNSLIQWNAAVQTDRQPMRVDVIGGLTAVEYSADSTAILTAGNDFQLTLWGSDNLTVLKTKTFPSRVVDIEIIGETELFLLGGGNQQVVILDISGEPTLENIGSLQYRLTAVAASPNGQFLAAGDINGGIAVWDRSGEKIKEVTKPRSYLLGDPADLDLPGSPHSISFSADGLSIFSGVRHGSLRSLDPNTGTALVENLSFTAHIKRFALSHKGQLLATQQGNGIVTVWDVWDGKPLYQLPGELKDGDPFSPDDERIAVSSAEIGPSMVTVHNAVDGEAIFPLKSQRDLKTIQFVGGGTQLVMVFDKSAQLWSMASGQVLETAPVYDGTGCVSLRDIFGQDITSVTNYHYVIAQDQNRAGICAFDPLDWSVAINEQAGKIVYGGASLLSLKDIRTGEDLNMRGVNQKNVITVAVNPDGSLIAAAYDDFTIHLWDTKTREEVLNLYGHNDTITGLHFTPDNRLLISTSLDGTIRLWGVPN